MSGYRTKGQIEWSRIKREVEQAYPAPAADPVPLPPPVPPAELAARRAQAEAMSLRRWAADQAEADQRDLAWRSSRCSAEELAVATAQYQADSAARQRAVAAAELRAAEARAAADGQKQ